MKIQKRKMLLILYEGISLFEITCLTAFLTSFQSEEESWQIDTVASSNQSFRSEDNFILQPEKLLDEIQLNDYEIILLSGIIDYRKVIDDIKLIQFLQQLNELSVDSRPLIAAISAAPILLAKAGILDDVKFTSGLFEETINQHEFIKRENIIRKPVHYDKNKRIITAIGFAFRNFTIEVAKLLGYDIHSDAFIGVKDGETFTEEALTFYQNT